MKNGRDDTRDDPKVTSLAAARKKAAQARRASSSQSGPSSRKGGMTELLVGAALVAMALGFVVHFTRPLWQGALSLAQ